MAVVVRPVLDFHALRNTFVSALNAGGASPALLGLARHTSPTTTLKHYARPRLHDVQGALAALPLPSSDEPEALRATGTDHASATPAQHKRRKLATLANTANILSAPESGEPTTLKLNAGQDLQQNIEAEGTGLE